MNKMKMYNFFQEQVHLFEPLLLVKVRILGCLLSSSATANKATKVGKENNYKIAERLNRTNNIHFSFVAKSNMDKLLEKTHPK